MSIKRGTDSSQSHHIIYYLFFWNYVYFTRLQGAQILVPIYRNYQNDIQGALVLVKHLEKLSLTDSRKSQFGTSIMLNVDSCVLVTCNCFCGYGNLLSVS